MLHPARLVVDLLPPHAEVVVEEPLKEAVLADHLLGDGHAPPREDGPLVGLVLDEAVVSQLLHHLGDAGGRDPQPLGELGVFRQFPLLVEGVDGLQVLLDAVAAQAVSKFRRT